MVLLRLIYFERKKMQLKLDVKTLVMGITLGIVITVTIGAGAGSADADRFGIAVEGQGYALVKTSDGSLYIVNPKEAMAAQVLAFNDLASDPDDNRSTSKGAIFRLEGSRRSTRTQNRN